MRLASNVPQDSGAKIPARPVPLHPNAGGPAPTPSWFRTLWPRGDARQRAHSVATDEVEDSLLAFAPESEAPKRVVTLPRTVPARPQPVAAPPRRLIRGRSAIIVLALLAVAQGALIALWLSSGPSAAQDTGAVRITSEPAGAQVSIDDVAVGATPLSTSLAAGPHVVTVRHQATARTQTVQVTGGGEASLHLELRPEPPVVVPVVATGGLQIKTEPSGAQVSIDGRPRGTAPLSIAALEPGSHVISVSSARGTVTQSVTVREGTISSVIISLAGTGAFASGWLAISSPITAQILEDGTLLGSSDTPRIMLSAGRHDLELANAALEYRVRRTVQITAGKTTSLTLDVPTGRLHINALPWANVWMGTRALGETPIANVSLPIGSHELVFRHPQLGEQRKTVVVGAKSPTRVGVDLRKGAR